MPKLTHCLLGLSLTTVGCSLSTFEPTQCDSDTQCQVAFGASSICRPSGYCSSQEEVPVRLGFIYSSLQNDKGWSQTHHDAAQATAENLDLDFAFRPSVQSADVAGVIDELATEEDANVIFTISSGYITETLNAANRYPDRYFASCCGFATGDNLTSYFGRMYQPIYVLGYVAARMSCTKRIGVVAALPLPQFVRHINAFTLGAQEADPDIEVDVRWVGAFFDPAVEGSQAEALMDAGSDVILAQSNSSAPVEIRPGATVACDQDGEVSDVPVFRIGYHSPTACESNPSQCLSSAFWNWTGLYEGLVSSVIEGNFDNGEVTWASMTNDSDSVVNYADFNGVVGIDIVAAAEERRGRTVQDPQIPFRGPISDNTGTVRIEQGEELTDPELDAMCWFVPGVISTEDDAAGVAAEVPSSCSGI